MEWNPPPDPLEDLRHLFRRACVLAHAGDHPAAERILHHELPDRIAAARERPEAAHHTTDVALRTAFAEERRRVEDAQLVGEVLLPKLQPTAAAAPAPWVPPPAAAPAPAPARPVAPARPTGSAAIVDLLDGMLAQDSARRAGGTRRPS